jgi:hypothetical protein
MLKNLHIPSRVELRDLHPEVPAEEKLEAINSAEPTVAPDMAIGLDIPVVEDRYRVYFADTFRKEIPYVEGMCFELHEALDTDESILEIDWLRVGDDKLYGHGIGTRLLQKAVEYGLESRPNLKTLTISPADMGLINTIGKVLGTDHVAVRRGRDWYGEGRDKPLEAILEDVPYRQCERYWMHEVRGSIDPARIQSLGTTAVQDQVEAA